jgi:hypothetical protein
MTKRKLTGILTLGLAMTAAIFGTACSKSSASPTDVFKAYYDAAVKKDFATAKKHLSKGSIALMEVGAKQSGKTFEEAMRDSPAAEGPMPQLSNEKITGDTATVDITADGQKAAMPFVKEDGEWKIALDKFAISALGGSTSPATTAPSTSGGTTAPSMPSASPAQHGEDGNDNANH